MSLRTTIQRLPAAARPTVSKRFASGGAQSWNPPTGYLWNEKPLPKGQKRKSPTFEKIAWFGYASFFAFGVAWYYKPNTSLQDWAMVQAKKRMEARGDLPKYIPSADHIARS